jgi:CRISPR system Cascade subunit CasD
MTGLVLRLAGPLQSWGDHSTFAERDTGRYPTRSGIIGMIASSMGRRRADPIDDLSALRFVTRVDQPGERLVDFHTIGGGLRRDQTVPTSDGGRRPLAMATMVSRRAYLTDAAFTVSVHGPDDVLTAVAHSLQNPIWAPFLGRRSCPAEAPLVIRAGDFDGDRALRMDIPVSRPKRTADQPIAFVYDQVPSGEDDSPHFELNDEPLSFNPTARRYAPRTAYIRHHQLPKELFLNPGQSYLDALLKLAPKEAA